MSDTLRILLVDDHVLFRKGCVATLSARPGYEVVGEASNGCEAIEQARASMPDIILMDINMPECSGLEATRQIKIEMPHIKIVMLTVSDDEKDLFLALKSGAQGYLLKNLKTHQLFDVLDEISRGEVPLSGAIAAHILSEFTSQANEDVAQVSLDLLSQREIEVLECVVEGDSNREIAEQLFISENTVKNHLRNILEKLHLKNRLQAAVYAVRSGLAGTDEIDP